MHRERGRFSFNSRPIFIFNVLCRDCLGTATVLCAIAIALLSDCSVLWPGTVFLLWCTVSFFTCSETCSATRFGCTVLYCTVSHESQIGKCTASVLSCLCLNCLHVLCRSCVLVHPRLYYHLLSLCTSLFVVVSTSHALSLK